MLPRSHTELWDAIVRLSHEPDDTQRQLESLLPEAVRSAMRTILNVLEARGLVELTKGAWRASEQDGPPLRSLHLELTHRCTFRCVDCYLGARLGSRSRAPTREVDAQTWIHLLFDAHSLGCRSVTLTGGEPLLYEGFLDIVSGAASRGMDVEVNTNAACVSAAAAQTLRSARARVDVTVYGFDVTSAHAYTRSPRAFERSMRGIRTLREHEVDVTAKYFATARTEHRFEEVRERLAPLGIECRRIGFAIHGDIFTGRPARTEAARTPAGAAVHQTGAVPCRPAGDGLCLEPDGAVRACPKIAVYLGNAFDGGLVALWRSAQVEAFRRFWSAYCAKLAYAPGRRFPSLCPAARLLGEANGHRRFQQAWAEWEGRPS